MSELWSLAEDASHKLRLNSPVGGWFPVLQDLTLYITESNLPYVNLFFSPRLKNVHIYIATQSWGAPRDIVPAISSTISVLPAPALQSLVIDPSCNAVPWVDFKDSLSSVVLRCGPSLREFTSRVPLSDAAVDHLIHLPHLHTWRAEGPPPSYSTSPMPLVFPPLTKLTLGKGTARGWISLFGRLENSISTTQGLTPLSKMKGSLKFLNLPCSTIDASLTSPVQRFRNLVNLSVGVDEGGEGECTFKLNNDSVTKLATSLSQLEALVLGWPCLKNSCATTVACLLPISVHCLELQQLMIHFNTTNIIEDLKNISEGHRFQDLRSLPKCTLSTLHVHRMPLALGEPGFATVVNGMVNIFPSLERCVGAPGNFDWRALSRGIAEVQKM